MFGVFALGFGEACLFNGLSTAILMITIRWPKLTLRRLVALGGLVFLGLLLLPAKIKFVGVPCEMRVLVVCKDLQVSLGHFRTEYNRLPVTADEHQTLRSDGPLLFALLGGVCDANPRGIKFIDFQPAREGRWGLTNLNVEKKPTLATALLDHWGERYIILLESTGDGLIPNPEYQGGANASLWHKPPPTIRASALIYSAGPDRDPNTWDDNVRSWRRDGVD